MNKARFVTLAAMSATMACVGATAACKQAGPAETGSGVAGDAVAAEVSGRTIWRSDVEREARAQGLIGPRQPLDPKSDVFARVLDEVIDQKLLALEAERRGLDDGAAAKRRLEATRDRVLADLLIETRVNGTVTDEAVAGIYEDQLRRADTGEEVRLRQIVSADRAAAEAATALLAQGSAFEAVARDRSTDAASKASGGDLGYVAPEALPAAYAEALRGQPAGALVGPFQTPGGWVVLKVEDRRRRAPPSLAEARPQIVRYLTYEGVRQLLAELRGKARIDVRGRTETAAPAQGRGQGGAS